MAVKRVAVRVGDEYRVISRAQWWSDEFMFCVVGFEMVSGAIALHGGKISEAHLALLFAAHE